MSTNWFADNWGKLALAGAAATGVAIGVSLLVEASAASKKTESRSHRLKRARTSQRSEIARCFALVKEGGKADTAFSPEQLQALYARFTQSSGGEKSITRGAFGAVFERMGVTDGRVIESAFKAWDADGNGEISFSEFASVVAVQKEGTKREKLEFLFEIWDVDGNGIITRPEMQKIFRTLCPGASASETNAAVAATFRSLDRDNSGTISRGEFVCTLCVNPMIDIAETDSFMERFVSLM